MIRPEGYSNLGVPGGTASEVGDGYVAMIAIQ
jgi:hypothetical protein